MSGKSNERRKSSRLQSKTPVNYVVDRDPLLSSQMTRLKDDGVRKSARITRRGVEESNGISSKASTILSVDNDNDSDNVEEELNGLALSDNEKSEEENEAVPRRRTSPRKTKLAEVPPQSNGKVNVKPTKKLLFKDDSDEECCDDEREDVKLLERDVEYVQYSSKYFVEQCILNSNKNKTIITNPTSVKGKMEKIDFEEVQELLKSYEDSHVEEKKKLFKKHCQLFERWKDLLIDNFNILLYGVGSKKNLLDKFTNELDEELRVVIHGFFPGLSIKEVMNSITIEALEHNGTFPSFIDHSTFINQYLEQKGIELYLIIHNIDGPSFANDKTISVLAHLAKSDHVHIIATVDHVNSGLLFDTNKLSTFKWLWFETHTFETYHIETSYENSMQGQQTETLAISSLRHVYLSLTPNAQGIFQLLAKSQLEKSNEAGFSGLSFGELFRQCRQAFLVNSDLTLRTQLIEFKDHNMLKMRKAVDGLEYLFIPVNSSTLSQFIEEVN